MNIKNIFKSALTLAALSISLSSCAQDKALSADEIPSEIKHYVKTHFPENTIIRAVLDRDGMEKTYDVELDKAIRLEFNKNKKIIDIDGASKLPDSVIPEALRNYVLVNYRSSVITDWELDGRKQQIELDSGVDLIFNLKGDFLRVDYD